MLPLTYFAVSTDRYHDQASFRFEGIPYANPPERFTYSTMYSGSPTLNATAYGPECIQSGVPEPYGSEDCLYLNIYTPYIPQDGTDSTEGLKPVMFWIHGYVPRARLPRNLSAD